MSRSIHKLTAVLLALLCLVPFFSFAASATGNSDDGDQALYVEKYVSVLYDNSGSMLNSSKNGYDNRAFYANYAFQMLASMINSTDKLWATPMNVKVAQPATVNDAILFPFTNDRGKDIADFAAKYLYYDTNNTANNKPLAPINGAGTPISSISGLIISRREKA